MTSNATIAVIVCVQCALVAWVVYRFTLANDFYIDTGDDDGGEGAEPVDPDEEWKRNLEL